MISGGEKAVLKTTEKCGGAFLSGFALSHDRPEEMRLSRYHMISGVVDIGLFRSACVEDVKRFKALAVVEDDDEVDNGKDGDEKYWSE
ncbi:hypothetical protein Hdeb2414_s0143g00812331 [Helianthus debilis subsp. tardiflorus]